LPVPSGSWFCPPSGYPRWPLGSRLSTATLPNHPSGLPHSFTLETKELEHRSMARSLRLLVLSTFRVAGASVGGGSFDHPAPNGSLVCLSRCMNCSHLLRRGPGSGPGVPRAQLATASPENFQCRSVFIHFVKSSGSSAPSPLARKCWPTASNPLLTHGTVESPVKRLLRSGRTAPGPGPRCPPSGPRHRHWLAPVAGRSTHYALESERSTAASNHI